MNFALIKCYLTGTILVSINAMIDTLNQCKKKKKQKKADKDYAHIIFRHTLEVMVTKLNNMNPEITAVNIFVIYFARFNLHIEICLYIITVSDHMYLYVYNFQHAVKFHVKK